jgi:Mor family transcriptional regulator
MLITDRAIAREIGVSGPSVHHLRKKYGIPLIRPDNTKRNDKIIAAYKQGASAASLSIKFNVWAREMKRILNDAGVLRNKPLKPPISKTELIKLQKSLITDVAIARKLGIKPAVVYYYRNKYGIPSPVPDNTERDKKIIAAYKKGASRVSLAKIFNLTLSRINEIIKDAGADKKNNSE